MSKIILFTFVALLAVTFISGATQDKTCGRHGDPCSVSSQCCSSMNCNAYAKRCQVRITAEDLQEAKKKLKHVEPKDRKGYTDIYTK